MSSSNQLRYVEKRRAEETDIERNLGQEERKSNMKKQTVFYKYEFTLKFVSSVSGSCPLCVVLYRLSAKHECHRVVSAAT
jgi:hypothetical protein